MNNMYNEIRSETDFVSDLIIGLAAALPCFNIHKQEAWTI